MSEQHKNTWRSRLTIIVIVAFFVLPILVSWFLVFFTDYGRDSVGTQHGVLINPPRQLQDVQLTDPLTGEKTALYEKWTLFLPVSGDCDQTCRDNLYAVRQIRLAMGKEMQRMQRASYFQGRDQIENVDTLFADYAGHLVLFAKDVNADFAAKLRIESLDTTNAMYLIDPAGFVVICYPEGSNPSGIIKDLKRLLRISKLD